MIKKDQFTANKNIIDSLFKNKKLLGFIVSSQHIKKNLYIKYTNALVLKP